MNYDEFKQRSKNKEEQNSCTSINCFAATFVREVNLPAKGIIPAEVRSIVHITYGYILWRPLQKTMCQTITVLLTVFYVCISNIDTYMYIYIYIRVYS